MKTRLRHHLRNCQFICRSGAMLPVMAFLMIVMLGMAAMSVDLAYIELVRTELRAATDSAARAAASALVRGQSPGNVQAVAIDTAALNLVAGKPLHLTTADVVLGQSIQQSDGTYQFHAGVQPYQAVQITASLSSTNQNGNVALFFAPIWGINSYSPTNTAVAAASSCDVCLVLDRSHSMCWDDTGTSWKYPLPYGLDTYGVTNILTGTPSGQPSGVFQQHSPLPGSRWNALQGAVHSFCDVLNSANGATKVGVVTWASTTPTQTIYSTLFPPVTLPASKGVTTDVDLTSDFGAVSSAVDSRSMGPLLGGTDMYTGIEAGISVLTGSSSRPSATKVMILMTDGDWSSPAGNKNPAQAAQNAKNDNIIIHCICFLPNSNQASCKKIATITGGKFYYATDAASLQAIFQQVAGTLPVGLTN